MTRTFDPRTLVLTLILSAFPLQFSLAADSETSGEALLDDSVVTSMPDLREQRAGPDRKIAFFNLLIPIIERQNAMVRADREFLLAARERNTWTRPARERLKRICDDYRMNCADPQRTDWDQLLSRVDTLPMQLVLVQAIEESGWGTSRFARESNNLFGMRCFGAECGVEQRGTGDRYQQFASVEDGVHAYFLNLNGHKAYDNLRKQRAALRGQGREVTAEALIASLGRYSVRGTAYMDQLRLLLNINTDMIESLRGQVDEPAA